MSIVYGYISVKEDENLLKALASEVVSTDDPEITENFLNQISVQYGPTRVKEKPVIQEDCNINDEGTI